MSSFNANASLFAGALAASGVSVCCVGRLLLSMLGIGGAWIAHLTALEPLRLNRNASYVDGITAIQRLRPNRSNP